MRPPHILAVEDALGLPEATSMVMEMLRGYRLSNWYKKVGQQQPLPK